MSTRWLLYFPVNLISLALEAHLNNELSCPRGGFSVRKKNWGWVEPFVNIKACQPPRSNVWQYDWTCR
ncbi:hypothetical protein NC651_004498 [Populus alba x Populus x berolinensis]|nr:hypothetical protein NC651_004498 [Populus alba x Populus x berolinensis]